MNEAYPPRRCRYCCKPIVRERVGWRSDEHDPSVDRVLCPDSPEPDVVNKKHEPAERMARIHVRAHKLCECAVQTGDMP